MVDQKIFRRRSQLKKNATPFKEACRQSALWDMKRVGRKDLPLLTCSSNTGSLGCGLSLVVYSAYMGAGTGTRIGTDGSRTRPSKAGAGPALMLL